MAFAKSIPFGPSYRISDQFIPTRLENASQLPKVLKHLTADITVATQEPPANNSSRGITVE